MYSIFETTVTVRPDDIDMNNHLHSSKYQDYLIMARYEQMKNDYKVPMSVFLERGYAWVVSEFNIRYKRQVTLADQAVNVQTQVKEIKGATVLVDFSIIKSADGKIAAKGQTLYTMISIKSGRATKIPEDLIQYYKI